MSSPRLEGFLARLYTDASLRDDFLREPKAVALREGLSEEESAAMADIDRVGLKMAAHSFEKKRESYKGRKRPGKLRELISKFF